MVADHLYYLLNALTSIVSKKGVKDLASDYQVLKIDLAKYCDRMHRKSVSGTSSSDSDDKLAESVTILKNLDDKNLFQRHYAKLLAKRLMYQSSAFYGRKRGDDEADQASLRLMAHEQISSTS
ncbi:hypothetical protein QYM36_006631 [Artemia franciscana]|uniref:Cullin family profile domain-containing protein n=1 Tax=Artemia franciscana TaxID=6661 RepID=A0AA88LA55_ARTSF|nr:hypothetical protein QYM36_006631 [Artemia franciscana]